MNINYLEKLVQTYLPLLISFSGLLSSILIARSTIKLTKNLDQKNERFQRAISTREMRIQSRESFLEFYHANLEAYDLVLQSKNNTEDIFTSTQSYMEWAQESKILLKNLNISYNKCNLIVDDPELSNILKQARDAFAEIYQQLNYYINQSFPEIFIKNAWKEISSKHNIKANDNYSLFLNPSVRLEFVQLCKNSYTDNINKAITAYCKIIESDSFDAMFKKHIQIDDWINE